MRSNFEIGRGGGTISASMLGGGGAQDTLFYQLFIILKILGEARVPPPPYSVVPGQGDIIIVIMLPEA